MLNFINHKQNLSQFKYDSLINVAQRLPATASKAMPLLSNNVIALLRVLVCYGWLVLKKPLLAGVSFQSWRQFAW